MIAASARNENITLVGRNPRVRSTAISGPRAPTAAYIVFTAPKMAPIAMMLAMKIAAKLRICVSRTDWLA